MFKGEIPYKNSPQPLKSTRNVEDVTHCLPKELGRKKNQFTVILEHTNLQNDTLKKNQLKGKIFHL